MDLETYELAEAEADLTSYNKSYVSTKKYSNNLAVINYAYLQ